MREPARVGDCVAAMVAAVPAGVPVTVKCRIGVDDQDDYADLERFVATVAQAGCRVFVVHARKAWLKGLSPKQNRELPPLDHGRVARLKAEHPQLSIVLNGGLADAAAVEAALAWADGVMLGRAAYHTPWLLAELQPRLFGRVPPSDRVAAVRQLEPYVRAQLAAGERLPALVRHWLGLANGLPGARRFRQVLTEQARAPAAGWAVVEQALEALRGRLAEAA
jgi:tRNA-dihydrouridine synthase A